MKQFLSRRPLAGLTAATAAALALAVHAPPAQAWPWSRDMTDSIAIKPQAHPMPFPRR